MKFQHHILNFDRTEDPKAICPFNFFKVGGCHYCINLIKYSSTFAKNVVLDLGLVFTGTQGINKI